jgi:hypothetical protein
MSVSYSYICVDKKLDSFLRFFHNPVIDNSHHYARAQYLIPLFQLRHPWALKRDRV